MFCHRSSCAIGTNSRLRTGPRFADSKERLCGNFTRPIVQIWKSETMTGSQVRFLSGSRWLDSLRRSLSVAFCGIVVLCAVAAEPVVADVKLTLTDGRHLIADSVALDAGGSVIEARIDRPHIVMVRRLTWSRVISVRTGGRVYSASEFRAACMANSPERRNRDQREPTVARHEPVVLVSASGGSVSPEVRAPAAEPERRRLAVADGSDSTGSAEEVGWRERRSSTDTAFCPAVPCWPAKTLVPGSLELRPVGLPTKGVVVGVREDPLRGYSDEVRRFFPNGVPMSERGFVLALMRARKAEEVLHDARPSQPSMAPPVRPLSPHRPSSSAIQSLAINAVPFNSRGKTDWDSLRVEVMALDCEGRGVAVRGTVQAALWRVDQRRAPLNATRFVFDAPGQPQRVFEATPRRVRRMATWTRRIDPGSSRPILSCAGMPVAESGISSILVLPLSAPLPDHDGALSPYGALHVRLSVPGHGVFETTQDDVLLRHSGDTRKHNLVASGALSLPHEGTSGRRRLMRRPSVP